MLLNENLLLVGFDMRLAVLDITQTPSARTRLADISRFRAVYLLPTLAPDVVYADLTVDGCIVPEPPMSVYQRDSPFLPRTDRSLLTISMDIHRQVGTSPMVDMYAFELLVPMDVLLRGVQPPELDTENIIPWETWGTGTRLFQRSLLDFRTYAHGSKYIITHPKSRSYDAFVTLLDFDSIPSIIADAASDDYPDKSMFHMQPTDMPQLNIWSESAMKVRPGAPYREIRTEIKVGQDEFPLVADDCIIVVQEAEVGGRYAFPISASFSC